jgi:hypothetical protein
MRVPLIVGIADLLPLATLIGGILGVWEVRNKTLAGYFSTRTKPPLAGTVNSSFLLAER